jgi:hypothetical protein
LENPIKAWTVLKSFPLTGARSFLASGDTSDAKDGAATEGHMGPQSNSEKL